LTIDDRILSYDGKKVRSYDLTTNQLFIQSSRNRLNIERFINKNILKNIELKASGNNYLVSLKDIGDFLVVVDSLKLINRIESTNMANSLIIENIEVNFLDSLNTEIFTLDFKGAMVFDMSNE
tara:strand:- start:331 stop:699 length:369 start_codon:yes stop_codon:yes gene_type:complete